MKQAGQVESFHALFYMGDLMSNEIHMAGQDFFLIIGEDREVKSKEHHKETPQQNPSIQIHYVQNIEIRAVKSI